MSRPTVPEAKADAIEFLNRVIVSEEEPIENRLYAAEIVMTSPDGDSSPRSRRAYERHETGDRAFEHGISINIKSES